MQIEKKMTEAILNNPERYQEDFKNINEAVAKSKAIYKGEPVPHLYVPKIYTHSDVVTFEKALEGMMDVVNRTIELYLAEESVRELFGFDPKLDALIRLPHFYDAKVPMGRFDIFYYGNGEYKFCELNTDGSSAMNEQKELAQVLKQSQIMKDFDSSYSFETHELFHSWVHAVEDIYAQDQKNRGLKLKDKADTSIAIVDFIDKGSSIEFDVFAEAFKSEGYHCIIVDPRDIKVSDGQMYANGKVIDVVYRRLVTKDLMDRYDEIPEFIEGLFAGKTCVIGSIKTQVVHTKRFFEVLYHPTFRKYLSQDQIDFIESHVPYTKALMANDIQQYIDQKDNYIIKPVDYYASKGVCAGSDYTEASWKTLLEEKSQEDFIVQRYAPLSLVDNVLYDQGEGFLKHSFRTITGLFVYNEKFAGLYVRGGLNAIISGLHSGYTFATFVAKEK
ncbi:glutathionylspermidine synthase family protein [Alkalicella caledoniensis]|uniref:Glutathionylspermidine synthase family protein n=1 Tax=Alkalicella caledoniensis TaxID=2731377 RepID=A0A7G9W5U1_ALKCA|nr:glutathionylspermidine synthase family protein [Alkalicella caledoniensis]QNO14053.1 glutathionylspermidine synthase family protein [Alkalicella caledoniensis]